MKLTILMLELPVLTEFDAQVILEFTPVEIFSSEFELASI